MKVWKRAYLLILTAAIVLNAVSYLPAASHSWDADQLGYTFVEAMPDQDHPLLAEGNCCEEVEESNDNETDDDPSIDVDAAQGSPTPAQHHYEYNGLPAKAYAEAFRRSVPTPKIFLRLHRLRIHL